MDHAIDPLTLDHKVNEISCLMMLSIIRRLSLLKNNFFNYKQFSCVNDMNNIIMLIIGVQARGNMASFIY
jgi:hypothetical protein